MIRDHTVHYASFKKMKLKRKMLEVFTWIDSSSKVHPGMKDMFSVQSQMTFPHSQGLGSVDWKFGTPDVPVHHDRSLVLVWSIWCPDLIKVVVVCVFNI